MSFLHKSDVSRDLKFSKGQSEGVGPLLFEFCSEVNLQAKPKHGERQRAKNYKHLEQLRGYEPSIFSRDKLAYV